VEFNYEEGANGPFKPVLRNVLIENVKSDSSGRVSVIAGFPGAVIEGLRLRDCVFSGVEAADSLKDAGTIELQNVTVEPARKEKN
jgi:unsaturated rhamnogalacturonyl hydrolase